MSEKMPLPIMVVYNGHRYVLTPSGVTRVFSVPDYDPRRRGGSYTTKTPGGPVFIPDITR